MPGIALALLLAGCPHDWGDLLQSDLEQGLVQQAEVRARRILEAEGPQTAADAGPFLEEVARAYRRLALGLRDEQAVSFATAYLDRHAGRPAPPAPDPDWTPPRPGEKRFVHADAVQLRSAPAPGAAVVWDLPINGEAQVLALDGGYAEVEIQRPTRRVFELAPDARMVSLGDVPGKPLRAWVDGSFLGSRPLEEDALLEQAKRLKGSDPRRELAALQRAAALGPPDRELTQRILTAAGELCELSTQAAAALDLAGMTMVVQPETDSASGDGAQLDFFWGCRGSRLRPATVEGDAQWPVPRDACLRRYTPVPLKECGCCEWEEEKADTCARRERDAHKNADAIAAHRERVRARYPSGPWFRVELHGTLRKEAEPLFGYQGWLNPGDEMGGQRWSAGIDRVFALPQPAYGGTEVVWIEAGPVGWYQITPVAGVLRAKSPEEAQRRLTENIRQLTSSAPPRAAEPEDIERTFLGVHVWPVGQGESECSCAD